MLQQVEGGVLVELEVEFWVVGFYGLLGIGLGFLLVLLYDKFQLAAIGGCAVGRLCRLVAFGHVNPR